MRPGGLKTLICDTEFYCFENTTDRMMGYCFPGLGWRLLYPGAKTEFIPFGSKLDDLHFADIDLNYAYATDIAKNFIQEMELCG